MRVRLDSHYLQKSDRILVLYSFNEILCQQLARGLPWVVSLKVLTILELDCDHDLLGF